MYKLICIYINYVILKNFIKKFKKFKKKSKIIINY